MAMTMELENEDEEAWMASLQSAYLQACDLCCKRSRGMIWLMTVHANPHVYRQYANMRQSRTVRYFVICAEIEARDFRAG